MRSRNFRNYIAHYSDGRNYLQIPKRHKEKFTIVFGDATLWVEVNSGRRSKSVQVCQTDELQFDRRNFVLCGKFDAFDIVKFVILSWVSFPPPPSLFLLVFPIRMPR